MSTLNDDLQDLESAEDFLGYFGIAYEQAVVHVNRLHILQRFHDYMQRVTLPDDEAGQRAAYHAALAAAYHDFVISDAITEKVFKVFQAAAPRKVPVAFTDIRSF